MKVEIKIKIKNTEKEKKEEKEMDAKRSRGSKMMFYSNKVTTRRVKEGREEKSRNLYCTCMTSVTSGCNALKDCSTVIIPLKCGPKHDESPKLFLIIGLTVLQYPGMFSCSNLMLNCFDSWETFTEHSSVPAFFNSNFLPCNMLTSI